MSLSYNRAPALTLECELTGPDHFGMACVSSLHLQLMGQICFTPGAMLLQPATHEWNKWERAHCQEKSGRLYMYIHIYTYQDAGHTNMQIPLYKTPQCLNPLLRLSYNQSHSLSNAKWKVIDRHFPCVCPSEGPDNSDPRGNGTRGLNNTNPVSNISLESTCSGGIFPQGFCLVIGCNLIICLVAFKINYFAKLTYRKCKHICVVFSS